MAEKHASSLGIVVRKSLFCLFVFTSIIFVLSWFFVLRSTINTPLIDHTLLSDSKPHAVIESLLSATENQNDAETSIGNRSILGNNEEEGSSSQHKEESSQVNNHGVLCHNYEKVVLKVFMYDLPPEFHFGLLDWQPKGNRVWPDIQTEILHYPGGLNSQHSIEFWLTLDLLASELPNPLNVLSAIRVRNSSEADIIFVPFFSSLSYNRYAKTSPHRRKGSDNLLQNKLVKYLASREEWKRWGGRDHLIMAHHPNSMLNARMQLWPATFILSDFGRYPPNVANLDKDVIAPYKHVVKIFVNDSTDFDSRPILMYFQGAIYRKDVCALFLLYLLVNFVFSSGFNLPSTSINSLNDYYQRVYCSFISPCFRYSLLLKLRTLQTR